MGGEEESRRGDMVAGSVLMNGVPGWDERKPCISRAIQHQARAAERERHPGLEDLLEDEMRQLCHKSLRQPCLRFALHSSSVYVFGSLGVSTASTPTASQTFSRAAIRPSAPSSSLPFASRQRPRTGANRPGSFSSPIDS